MKKMQIRMQLVCLFSMLLLFFPVELFAQQGTITGKVVDERGESVIGATVMVKGSTDGTITDLDGNFKITVADAAKARLVVSYIGYETQEVPLQGKKSVKIVLQETFNELEEVTVVAYGVQKKETLTGAISSVKTDALLQSPNSSVANSLAGSSASVLTSL